MGGVDLRQVLVRHALKREALGMRAWVRISRPRHGCVSELGGSRICCASNSSGVQVFSGVPNGWSENVLSSV
ncbi:hypothetical protein ART_1319 [Arthrobacter sp. PAMC 25486]|nr:hypothetical protein ART_1319 [Arthrobacter sp. PAMC 25486]